MNALINSFGSEIAAAALPSCINDYLWRLSKATRENKIVSLFAVLPARIADYCMEAQRDKPFWRQDPLPVHLKEYWKEAEELTITITEDSPGLNLNKGAKVIAERLPVPNGGRLEPGVYGLMVGESLIVARVRGDGLPLSRKSVRAVWRCQWVVSMEIR